MTVQLTYSEESPRAVAGMIPFGVESHKEDITGIMQGNAKPGLVVTRVSGQDNAYELPNAAGDLLRAVAGGVLLLDPGKIPSLIDDVLYEDGHAVPIRRKGHVYMITETAMAKGSAPFVRVAGTGTIGSCRNTADSGNAIACPWLLACETTTAGGVALFEVLLPLGAATA